MRQLENTFLGVAGWRPQGERHMEHWYDGSWSAMHLGSNREASLCQRSIPPCRLCPDWGLRTVLGWRHPSAGTALGACVLLTQCQLVRSECTTAQSNDCGTCRSPPWCA